MADYFIESDSLVAIADAIREPIDESDIIYPEDMADKIRTDLGNVKVIAERTTTEIKHNDVGYIGSYAFYSHPTLVSANFPKCTTIADGAFKSCVKLETAYFPACGSINEDAFEGCTKIENATIGILNIASESFPFKNASATLGNLDLIDCTAIGSSALYGYKKLSSIYLAASEVVALHNVNAFGNTPMSNSTYLSSGYGSIYVPESLVTQYKVADNWSKYADRITYIQ